MQGFAANRAWEEWGRGSTWWNSQCKEVSGLELEACIFGSKSRVLPPPIYAALPTSLGTPLHWVPGPLNQNLGPPQPQDSPGQ